MICRIEIRPGLLVLCIALCSLSFASVFGQKTIEETLEKFNEHSVPYIGAEQLCTEKYAALLDTRSREEYEVSHLKDALWVGYKNFDAKAFQSRFPDKNASLIVYCSVGVRSEEIGEKLQDLGYTEVKNLYGGIFDWKNKGHPVYDLEGKTTERVHAFDKVWGRLLKNAQKVFPEK